MTDIIAEITTFNEWSLTTALLVKSVGCNVGKFSNKGP